MTAASGSAQLRAIAVALREAGEQGNLNALRRGTRAEATPLIAAARGAARRDLPKSGGLAEYEANQAMRVAVLTGARTAGVRIIGKASLATDTGTWRHPDPNGESWSEQTDPLAAGWWSDTMREHAPEVTAAILVELEAVGARIQGV